MSSSPADRLVVVWRVTQHCNLGCGFCAYDRRLPGPRRSLDPEVAFAFGSLLAEHQRLTGIDVLVSWLGGEPLGWPPLTALTTRFWRELGLGISATTNGTTLGSEAVRAHLLAAYAEITISVDGMGPLHDSLRGWPGGFASLKSSLGALAREKRAAGRGPIIRVNTVLMRDNIAGFFELCRELARWGVEEVTFNLLGGNDRPEFHALHSVLPDQLDAFLAELPAWQESLAQETLRARGLRLRGGPGYAHRLRATARGERLSIDDCQPGRRFLFMTEDRVVSPCSFTSAGYGVPLSALQTPASLATLPELLERARRHERLTPCHDCQSTQVFEKFSR